MQLRWNRGNIPSLDRAVFLYFKILKEFAMIITLKDNTQKKYDNPIKVSEIAAEISEGLARNAVCGN